MLPLCQLNNIVAGRIIKFPNTNGRIDFLQGLVFSTAYLVPSAELRKVSQTFAPGDILGTNDVGGDAIIVSGGRTCILNLFLMLWGFQRSNLKIYLDQPFLTLYGSQLITKLHPQNEVNHSCLLTSESGPFSFCFCRKCHTKPNLLKMHCVNVNPYGFKKRNGRDAHSDKGSW